jgi:hypothetical protein
MVIIFPERFVPELGMYREYRGTPRTEKITEDAATPVTLTTGLLDRCSKLNSLQP